MKINLDDGHITEFKQRWHLDYLKWICAFLNSEGGTLYIGVDDKGEICGVTNTKKLLEDIPSKIRSTMGLICSISLLTTDDGKEYIKIKVNYYSYPVSFRGKYYKRSGSTLHEINGIELDRILLNNNFPKNRTIETAL